MLSPRDYRVAFNGSYAIGRRFAYRGVVSILGGSHPHRSEGIPGRGPLDLLPLQAVPLLDEIRNGIVEANLDSGDADDDVAVANARFVVHTEIMHSHAGEMAPIDHLLDVEVGAVRTRCGR